ncbi:DUF6867 family protein [Thioflexithrix psekupsensis]|uniref:DUF6867 domain-containing protein n=1 Tax=Thioflexithrix psekupsensis TaxID=1570016 RepID=A0A251X8N1_9GAMM|nr:hypothetical protein [Thioflexithrix psekupsensis]OUD14134.1 hypothetical protein TPSD3_07305 [Thioflexithrix psekupsensis]
MFGDSIWVFWIVSVGIFGAIGFAIGQAVASQWQSFWLVVWYACLLGAFERFIIYALFGDELLSVLGYLIDTAVIIAMALFGYRLMQVKKMVTQYPWLYARMGFFFWKEKV